MIGTIVNTISIITGTAIGSITKKGIKEEYQNALFNAIGLCAFCSVSYLLAFSRLNQLGEFRLL